MGLRESLGSLFRKEEPKQANAAESFSREAGERRQKELADPAKHQERAAAELASDIDAQKIEDAASLQRVRETLQNAVDVSVEDEHVMTNGEHRGEWSAQGGETVEVPAEHNDEDADDMPMAAK